MRRVDWPIVIGPRFDVRFSPGPSQGVVSVLSAADELASYGEIETILRRAVELARDRLSIERVALFLLGEDGQLYGTFGTGLRGETTDERDIVFAPGESHREAMARSRDGTSRWLVLEGVPLVAQAGGKTVVVGKGWNALTPVRSRREAIGLFVNDAAFSRSALDDSRQVRLAVLAAILGSLLELKRKDAAALPWSPSLSSPGAGPALVASLQGSACWSEDVRAALRRLGEEPTLATAALAKSGHVTARTLAKHFRAQVGVTLVEYRNRVRVERFLGLVERGGGNLLEAALEAGFGSYAQFHRVFRHLVGVTPKEYVTGRER